MVFLEGESGAGKSALLQAGLVPALRGHPGLLPIYVESLAGSDWERDPRVFLATALWSALDEASRERMGLRTVPGANAVRVALETVSETLGRTPLILLDQFDDYQLRHYERFLSRKTWLKPGRLSEQNGFWRDLRELLASGTIHLVVVTRTDSAAGLTSVRFAEPETYRLDRLSSHFVGPLLAELAKDQDGQKVIGDPDYGWTLLQARLSADLERVGTILPQQLKIVLAGLGALPGRVLTVAAYERADGSAGLEARFIEDRIDKAARLHGATGERVRAALLAMVDPITGQKTVERRTEELLSGIDPAAPERAQQVLGLLAQEEVIRRRIDPRTVVSSWLLDHDYLARAVREVDRRANRWQRTLAEGAKALADTGASWTRRWRALLPPTVQLAFFWDRLRGRFHYGEHRTYATKSLSRFGPYLTFALVIVTLGLYEAERRSEERIQAFADDILNRLEFKFGGNMWESDVEALLHLASADELVRRRTLSLILTNPDRARKFVQAPAPVIRAVAGVSPRLRSLAAEFLKNAAVASSPNRFEMSRAIAEAARLLGQTEAVPLSWWMASIKGTTNPDALIALVNGLAAFPGKLSDTQAKDMIASFLVAIKRASTNPYAEQRLGTGLETIIPKLTNSQAKDAIGAFLNAIKGESHTDALVTLGRGLRLLCPKLADSQAGDAIEPFLGAIRDATNPYSLWALGSGLAALPTTLTDRQAEDALEPFLAANKRTFSHAVEALSRMINNLTDPDGHSQKLIDLPPPDEGLRALIAKFTDSQAKDAINPLLAAIKATTDADVLESFGTGLAAVPAQLTDSQAEVAVLPFLAAIKKAADVRGSSFDSNVFWPLGRGLKAVSAKLTDSQAKNAIEPFLTVVQSITDPTALGVLSGPLEVLSAKLTDDQAKEAVESFLAVIKSVGDPASLSFLAGAMEVLSAKLTDSLAKDAVSSFLAVLGVITDPQALAHLSNGLGALSGKFTDGQAVDALSPFLNAIYRTTDPEVLKGLSVGMGALTGNLADKHAREAIESLLATLKSATDPNALRVLAMGVNALPAPLTDRQAVDALDQFLAATKGTTEFNAAQVLGNGLSALAAKLTPRQARDAVGPLLSAIEGAQGSDALGALGKGLEPLAAKLTDNDAEDVLGLLLAALKRTTNPYTLNVLAKGLGALPAKLSDSQATEVIEPFLTVITGTRDPKALKAVGEGVGAISAELGPASATGVDIAANRLLVRTANNEIFVIYAKLSSELTRYATPSQQITRIFGILRHPLATGETTKNLLSLLEHMQGVQARFDGDLWKAVEWAEAEQKAGRLRGLDLNAPLPIN
ncbi:MAG: hypothetical protein E6G90_02010 [Alphaproteobacteria bacterium]|nr:MAG: hypothetical protein E6G90_02010 [Alphaproteobacteria bacterium]